MTMTREQVTETLGDVGTLMGGITSTRAFADEARPLLSAEGNAMLELATAAMLGNIEHFTKLAELTKQPAPEPEPEPRR